MNTDTPPSQRHLYELVVENGRSASPFVWRIRYALGHKRLSFETIPVGFTDIQTVFEGRFKTVPVLEDGAQMVGDSWVIAEYLDRTYPNHPALFSGPAEHAMVKLFEAWFTTTVMNKMFRIYVLDIHDASRPQDRAYFRQSREAMLRTTSLETVIADRETHLPALRSALAPLRVQLSRFPFLGGAAPNYADYIALGAFQWLASVSTLPLLERTDPLIAWLDRGFDLYNGLGRDSLMKPLIANG